MKGETVVEVSARLGLLWCASVLAALVACGGEGERQANAASGGSGASSAGGKGGAGGDASGARGGASGGSEGEPPLPEGPPPSVDLLLVIDNSISMGEKQALLDDALPHLVRRFAEPLCVDESGTPVGPSQSGACADGELEFPPVKDLHLGVVTSSLGAHGGQVCADEGDSGRFYDDKAHLIATVRDVPSWNDSGFLAWDPGGTANTPPGESSADALGASFADHVRAAGETGCGYEASLEAWYRFLIDPYPPASVSRIADITSPEGVDQILLAQREAFLRPDSLVYIVMLTDENDCSIVDMGDAWLVGYNDSPAHLPPATSTCATDPNSPCCRSCATVEDEPAAGCTPVWNDPGCAEERLPEDEDPLNLRCWDQKRRFGFDLLHPTSRYVEGLTSTTIRLYTSEVVDNPLFAPRAGKPARPPSRVVLAGILGVPWQDLATDESLTGPSLTFLSAAELRDKGRWDMILGAPQDGISPTDPLMIESNRPRVGTHPLTNSPLASAQSLNPLENIINGHEHLLTDDLQYACIFPLGAPRDCSDPSLVSCPCSDPGALGNLPLCQPPGGGGAGTTQYFAKAHPSLRQLEVLRELGRRSVVTSACPKLVSGDKDDLNYGYNPALRALIDQTKDLLIGN